MKSNTRVINPRINLTALIVASLLILSIIDWIRERIPPDRSSKVAYILHPT